MGLFDMLNSIASKAMEKYGEAAQEISSNPKINSKLDFGNWDGHWISIGRLKDADLSPYNHCVGLYRHKINGQIKYLGRAIELNNGGFRKRLSDYRRDSDSARKHSSGRKIYENLDRIYTDILIVGDDNAAVELTKKLEILYIGKYRPEWNKMFN